MPVMHSRVRRRNTGSFIFLSSLQLVGFADFITVFMQHFFNPVQFIFCEAGFIRQIDYVIWLTFVGANAASAHVVVRLSDFIHESHGQL